MVEGGWGGSEVSSGCQHPGLAKGEELWSCVGVFVESRGCGWGNANGSVVIVFTFYRRFLFQLGTISFHIHTAFEIDWWGGRLVCREDPGA